MSMHEPRARICAACWADISASSPRRSRFPTAKPLSPSCPGEHRPAFNLSHSSELAVVAVTRGRRVGIDVEHLRQSEQLAQIARRYFAPAEQRQLEAFPAGEFLYGFFSCWVRKEAYLKALGEGLRIPLDSFSVNLGCAEPAGLIEAADGDADLWRIYPIRVLASYVCALAVDGNVEIAHRRL
jgi:4'-phosphopantetheinyl transferase